jgi:ACT domain-containing protein
MMHAQSGAAVVVDVAAVYARARGWTERIDGHRMSDMLTPMIIGATAHVDLLDTADRTQGEGRACETRKRTIPWSRSASIHRVTSDLELDR